MNLKEYMNYLPFLFQAKVTPLVWGVHGIGKTTKPAEWANQEGHRLFNLRLGNMELGDLLGLADFVTDGKGNRVATKFFRPNWMQELFTWAAKNPTKYAIIHLDEINRVRKDMLNPVFQMALEFRLHEDVFPDNVRVIASANPPVDGYWVNDFAESALLDRFCHLELRPETGEWLNYATSQGLSQDWIDFIADQPHQLHAMQTKFSVDDYCKPSNRSTEGAAKLYQLGAPKELIFGCVGGAAGNAFYTFVEKNKETTIEPAELYKYTKKTKAAVQALVEKGRTAQIKVLVTRLEAEIEAQAQGETPRTYTLKEGAALCEFYTDIPIDITVASMLTINKFVEMARVLSYDPDSDGKGYEKQDAFLSYLQKAFEDGKIDRAALNREDDKKAG